MLPAMPVEPAAPPVAPSAVPPAAPPSWPDQATDLIVQTVGTVRDKTTGPAITGARMVVYGTFGVLVAIVAFILVVILLVRVITVYLTGGRVWITDLALGAVFSVVGVVLWSKAAKASKGTA
jgi:hypothetical protein